MPNLREEREEAMACPWCGETATDTFVPVTIGPSRGQVRCDRCGACGPELGVQDTYVAAIEADNEAWSAGQAAIAAEVNSAQATAQAAFTTCASACCDDGH